MSDLIDDLAKLPSIDDNVVMETLHIRHQADQIYTKNGAVLVAINPYKNVGVSDESHLLRYKSSMDLANDPPHIFAVAAAAHRALISEGKNQALVISGESGAGKTESARFILQYLRYVSNASHALEERVTKSQPITEAFGCAKTVRNDNRCAATPTAGSAACAVPCAVQSWRRSSVARVARTWTRTRLCPGQLRAQSAR